MADDAHGEDDIGYNSLRFDWTANLGILTGAVLTLIIAIRFLAIANWDVVTATAVLTAIGPANAALGTLISSFLIVLAYLLGGTLGVVLHRRWTMREPLLAGYGAYGVVGAGISLGLLPIAYYGVVLLLVFWPFFYGWLERRKTNNRSEDLADSRFVGLAITSLGLTLLVMGPWLPAENITPQSGDRLVGYVLSEDADRSAVLLRERGEATTVVRYFEGPLGREICDSSTWADRSVLDLVIRGGDNRYDECRF